MEDHLNEVGNAILGCEIPRDEKAEAEARKWASPTLTRPRRAKDLTNTQEKPGGDLGSLIESFVSSCARANENPVWALHRKMLEAKTNDFVAST